MDSLGRRRASILRGGSALTSLRSWVPNPKPRDDLLPDDDRYWRVVYHTTAEGNQERAFYQPGDHLYVAEIVGRRQVYVRLGDRNSYLPLVAGATFRRRFDRLTFRSEDAVTIPSGLGQTRVTCFVSWGPLVSDPLPRQGADGGLLTGSGTAGTTMASIFAPAISGGRHPTPGKRGGVLVLTNGDMLNTIYLRYGDPATVGVVVPAECYRIPAGASLALPLAGLIHRPTESILVGTTAGTAGFDFLVSPGTYDLADTSQVQGVSIE
jgi:hypothetical protein